MKGKTNYLKLSKILLSITLGLLTFSTTNNSSNVNATSDSLTENTYTSVTINDNQATYYNITVPSDGYITFETKEPTDTVYNLYNSSNKLLDGTTVTKNSDYRATFTVKKGTYRLGTSTSKNLNYSFRYLFSNDRTLSSGKTFSTYPASKKQVMYYKIKPNKTGYITLLSKNTACYITLCNKNKSALSSNDYINNNIPDYDKVVYGVKKGATYYIKMTSSNPKVTLKYSLRSVSDKSGSKKSKAYKLKAGKKITGLIIANKKTVDWYKFKLSKSKKISLTLAGSTNDQLYIQIYNANGESILYSDPYVDGANFNKKIASINKLKAQTYYIKIARGNSKSSGYYTLKLK